MNHIMALTAIDVHNKLMILNTSDDVYELIKSIDYQNFEHTETKKMHRITITFRNLPIYHQGMIDKNYAAFALKFLNYRMIASILFKFKGEL